MLFLKREVPYFFFISAILSTFNPSTHIASIQCLISRLQPAQIPFPRQLILIECRELQCLSKKGPGHPSKGGSLLLLWERKNFLMKQFYKR